MTKREYIVALSAYVSFGPMRLGLLLNYYKDPGRVWKLSQKELSETGLSDKIVKGFEKHRKEFDPQDYFNRLNQLGIDYLLRSDKTYPENLKDISAAPLILYTKGDLLPQDNNAVAVVGSRKMSSYGKEVAYDFSKSLAERGVTIVSGLARGIDTRAHKAALEAGGRTIAVVAQGLDSIYPPENTALAEAVASSGAVVSEYPLGYPAIPSNFVSRNRIVSGLAKAVLVVEGMAKSGTLLTASHAAEQGRDVYAVPGTVTSPLSGAPLYLLKNGAKIATCPEDILNDFGIADTAESKAREMSPEEEEIAEILKVEPLHLDEIVRISSLDTATVSARLSLMEIKGMVRNTGGGIYRRII